MKKNKKQKKQAKTNFFKRILFIVFSLMMAVLLVYFFVFPSLVNNDIKSKNILIVSDKLDVHSNYIYLAHISDNGSKNTILSMPAEQVVIVPGGYGEYPLQSVYQLLKIDKKDNQFIKYAYSKLLGISIDEIILVNDQLNEISENEFSRYFITRFVKNISKAKLAQIYNSLYLHYKTKDVVLLKAENLDNFNKYQNEFKTIHGVLSQHCSVAVVNASGENGVAGQTGDVIEKAGAIVVRIDDVPELQDTTTIYYGSNPVDCKQLAEKISGIFKVKPEFVPIEKLKNAQQYRAKVVVVVGK